MRPWAPTARSLASLIALTLAGACSDRGSDEALPDALRPVPARDARPDVDAYRPVDAAVGPDLLVPDAVRPADASMPADAAPAMDAEAPADALDDALATDAAVDATAPADAAPEPTDATRRPPRNTAQWVAGGGVLRGARFTLSGSVGPVPQGAGTLTGARFHLRAGVLQGETPP